MDLAPNSAPSTETTLPKTRKRRIAKPRQPKRTKLVKGETVEEGKGEEVQETRLIVAQEETQVVKKKKRRKTKGGGEWAKKRLLPRVLKMNPLTNFHVKALFRLLVREIHNENWPLAASLASSLFRFFNMYPKVFFPLTAMVLKHVDGELVSRFYRKFIAKKQSVGELVVMELAFSFATGGQLEVAYDHLAQSLRGLESSAWVHGYMAKFALRIALDLRQELSELEGSTHAISEDKVKHFLDRALQSIRLAGAYDPFNDTYLVEQLRILKQTNSLEANLEAQVVLQQFCELNPTNPNGVRLQIERCGVSAFLVKELLKRDPLSEYGFHLACTLAERKLLCDRDLVSVCCNRLDYCSDDDFAWETLAQTLFLESEVFTYRYKKDLEPHLEWWSLSPNHFGFQQLVSHGALQPSSNFAKLLRLRLACAKLLGVFPQIGQPT